MVVPWKGGRVTSSVRVTIAPNELPALRAAMRDAQMATAAFYAQTASNASIDDLGTPVRNFLSAAQTINELLTNKVCDSATYKRVTSSGTHPGAGIVRAMKYVRNVVQHLPHVIRPRDEHVIIGGLHGLRIYASWDEVPATVHAQLMPSTQKLQSDYVALLQGEEVIETMLATLNFFSEVAPDVVHRDRNGEWTGFPLMSQPGARDRLHPEEPADEMAARAWLDGRPPNGDLRVICGQLTVDGIRYVFGHTFVGGLSFAPFIETTDQVDRDAKAGFLYLVGDLAANIEDRTSDIPQARQGAVWGSRDDVRTWATPAPSGGWDQDWVNETTASARRWRVLVDMERGEGLYASSAYLIRRAQRLNALVPPFV